MKCPYCPGDTNDADHTLGEPRFACDRYAGHRFRRTFTAKEMESLGGKCHENVSQHGDAFEACGGKLVEQKPIVLCRKTGKRVSGIIIPLGQAKEDTPSEPR